MSSEEMIDSDNPDSLIKDNWMSALHHLKFTKTTNDVFETLQIERRSLAAKYMGAKTL